MKRWESPSSESTTFKNAGLVKVNHISIWRKIVEIESMIRYKLYNLKYNDKPNSCDLSNFNAGNNYFVTKYTFFDRNNLIFYLSQSHIENIWPLKPEFSRVLRKAKF